MMRRLILISFITASAQLFTGALAMAQTPSPALPNQALYDPQDRRDLRVIRRATAFGDEFGPGEIQWFRRRLRTACHKQTNHRSYY